MQLALTTLSTLALLWTAMPASQAQYSQYSQYNVAAANSSHEAPITGNRAINISVGGCGYASSTPYPIADGMIGAAVPRFTYIMENGIAEFISLHFSHFNLPANDYIIIRPTFTKTRSGEYGNSTSAFTTARSFRYDGRSRNTSFFTESLFTQSITLELFTSGATEDDAAMDPTRCKGFTIEGYRYLAEGGSVTGSSAETVCGADESEEAACTKGFPQAHRSAKSVLRLLVHKQEGSFFCTGWLVGDGGYMLTNHHCISSQDHASNTEYEFMGEGSSCEAKCNFPLGCRGAIQATSAQFITASESLDYALVKFDIDFSKDYGFLQMRETGASMDERVYIPQHPAGWGKRLAMKAGEEWGRVVSLSQGGCLPDQVAYNLDTQGGSSGSPVISWKDHVVVALHHCGGCPNTAVNTDKIIADLRVRNVLPPNSVAF